ncbi:mitochondrial distribution and morphology protein 34 [Yarrowia lipolytica]|uniref:Mitochondrial distribution and morphology protein 34 n=1 Tax=Yarrowia lipolytica (strain CLIB 122 / E 150) TaxID=284591 RepID=MDM34_YARLI|nr:YALI0D24926p [Yarrowia lipolytica CLIB122]Q6C7W0.1 RecName: Full=Mitochondrial distribution and morphology protein 34 [Yarrowia lipolytica CLIB122]RDW37783.1 mitochondrial distribution and morphology protein 34 [Yarrowia lipolytica]CAG81456.1 YALI0D24926p [Yarrowia lipolytica CLIB122]|eukprot:XP_503252.1 YALI0D24926p [Yarrowia lipolytica CLIB122]
MSFKFDWESLRDESFYERAKTILADALNSDSKPPIIVDDITVKDLDLGDESPFLEILEIGDMADDRFRGIFKLNYTGNASLTLTTKVQANPLNVYRQSFDQSSFVAPQFLAAGSSLAIPLNLTLSDIRLSGIIILVFSRAKGLTLVFRNDPLESIKVSSTFDAIPPLAKFLQVQIENQIRGLFRELLPGIIHRLSQKWVTRDETKSNSNTVMSPHVTQPPSPKLKPVSIMDINPDLPALSPTNMLKISALCASQRTLSLFTPSISDAVYRSNLEQFDVVDEESQFQSEDPYDIVRIQSRNYYRHNHQAPKRRTIKYKRKSKKTDEGDNASTEVTTRETTPLPTSSTPLETSTPSREVIREVKEKLLAEPSSVVMSPSEEKTTLRSIPPPLELSPPSLDLSIDTSLRPYASRNNTPEKKEKPQRPAGPSKRNTLPAPTKKGPGFFSSNLAGYDVPPPAYSG